MKRVWCCGVERRSNDGSSIRGDETSIGWADSSAPREGDILPPFIEDVVFENSLKPRAYRTQTALLDPNRHLSKDKNSRWA
jgi:hypothetical protein